MIQKRHSQNFRSDKRISCHWSLSLPSENIRKTEVSDVFRGYRKRPIASNWLTSTN